MPPPSKISSFQRETHDISKFSSKNEDNDNELSTSIKRRRDSSMDGDAVSVDNDDRSIKSLRLNKTLEKPQNREVLKIADLIRDLSPAKTQQTQVGDQVIMSWIDDNVLTDKQKDFLHRWYEDFACHSSKSLTSFEYLNSLATLLQARPQSIYEYISKKYVNTMNEALDTQYATPASTEDQPNHQSAEIYSLAASNDHLPPTTLTLVKKFISTCQRRRPSTDGRRTVNSGPFRCTFGCGYRTKRAFDWRRHEETHEPQELWLCILCCPVKGDTETPKDAQAQTQFLVGRKDKFLRHAKDAHKKWMPEELLEMSRVGYKAITRGRCESCGGYWVNWDERCKHVLGHFEDDMERSVKKEEECGNVEKSDLLEGASSEAGDQSDRDGNSRDQLD